MNFALMTINSGNFNRLKFSPLGASLSVLSCPKLWNTSCRSPSAQRDNTTLHRVSRTVVVCSCVAYVFIYHSESGHLFRGRDASRSRFWEGVYTG